MIHDLVTPSLHLARSHPRLHLFRIRGANTADTTAYAPSHRLPSLHLFSSRLAACFIPPAFPLDLLPPLVFFFNLSIFLSQCTVERSPKHFHVVLKQSKGASLTNAWVPNGEEAAWRVLLISCFLGLQMRSKHVLIGVKNH